MEKEQKRDDSMPARKRFTKAFGITATVRFYKFLNSYKLIPQIELTYVTGIGSELRLGVWFWNRRAFIQFEKA